MKRVSVRVLVVLLLAVSPGAAQTVPTFLQADAQVSTTTTYTFTAANLGTAAADRYIIVASAARKSGTTNCTRPTVTVQGLTPTQIVSQARNPTNCNIVAIDKVAVPTGTTGDIVLTYPASMLLAGISVYRSTSDRALAASNTGASAADDPTGTITIQPHGYAIGVSMTSSAGATTTWTGLTESHDTAISASNNHTSALLAPATLQSAITVTADWSAAVESAGVWAAWAPIGPLAATPTHYVTASGNGSSACLVGDPCTITRAAALCGGDLMPPGSMVNVASGIYGQAAVTLSCNGTQAFPIKFVAATAYGPRFVGGRTSLPAAGWTLTTDQTFTYQHAFDDVALYAVTNVAQRPPVSTWVDIEVDDRASPFAVGSGRAYSHVEPVRYTPRASIAEVEAQHCTFFHSGGANLLYIHPCREGAPSDADNYYAGSSGWGTIIVTGDDLWLEGLAFEQTTGQGLLVDTGANRFTGRHLDGMASQFWFRGTNATLEDIEVTNVADQGAVDPRCYSTVYGGANGRSCWNDSGDGYQILFGQQGNPNSSGTATNARALRGWNGVRIDGAWTVDGLILWGFVNHAAQMSGTGGTVRNAQCANIQDCFYAEGESLENFTLERSLLFGGVLVWCSRDGATQGGVTCPTSWTFRRNIFGSMVTDDLTEPTVDSDCNVGIPRSPGQSALWRCTQVDGAGCDNSWVDMAAVQAGSTHDDNSLGYASTAWTNASVFKYFSNQQNALDFTLSTVSPLATSCGRAGPENLSIFFGGPFRIRLRLPGP